MSRRVRVLQTACASALVTFACIKIPEFQPRDAGNGSGDGGIDAPADAGSAGLITTGVTAVDEAGQYLVTGPTYRMRFSSEGFRFPYTLFINNVSVLRGVQTSCNESDVGWAFHPGMIGTATTPPGNVVDADITAELAGGPIAKLGIEWAAGFTCNQGAQAGGPNGRSSFTFYPNGKVVRFDHLRHTDPLAAPDVCACSGGSWFITTFMTLNRDVIGVTVPANLMPQSAGGETTYSDARAFCFSGHQNNWQLGFGYRFGNRTRVRAPELGSGATIPVVRDMVAPTSSIASNFSALTSTIMWLDAASNCQAVVDNITPFTDNATQAQELAVESVGTSGVVELGLAGDGMFGGETTQSAGGHMPIAKTVRLRPADGTTSLLPFAVRLVFEPGDTVVRVTKAPSTPSTPWYGVQQMGSGHFVFWFAGGLAAGESITIEMTP